MLPVVGTMLLRVWRGDFMCRFSLDCKLVNSTKIWPLLDRKTCIGMKIVAYLDNDALDEPQTRDSAVYTLNITDPVTKEQLINRHPKVFGKGVAQLESVYHIQLDESVDPVQHAPRRTPIAMRENSKKHWMA